MAASGLQANALKSPTGVVSSVGVDKSRLTGLSSSAFTMVGIASATLAAPDTKTPAVVTTTVFDDFLKELLGASTRKALYETIASKASFPELSTDIKTFFEAGEREGAKFSLEHLAIEPLVFVALALQAAKNGKKVVAHYGGKMLEPVTVLEKIFKDIVDEKNFPYYPDRILHIHTEDILDSKKAHKPAKKFAAITGTHNAGSPKDLEDASIFIFECYGAVKAGQQLVRNSVPPTGAIFDSMMRYYLKCNPHSIKVFCGDHHDVRKNKTQALEDAKKSLDKFYTEHASWMKGSAIPSDLLGPENAGKGDKISFITEHSVRGSDEYKLVLAKLMEIFSKDANKKQLFIDAIVTATARHLLDQFAKEKGFSTIKELKNSYNGRPKLQPASAISDSGSSSGSSPSGSESDEDDERAIREARRLARRAKKMAKQDGKDLDIVELKALYIVGTFGGRGNSPDRGAKKLPGKHSPGTKNKDAKPKDVENAQTPGLSS